MLLQHHNQYQHTASQTTRRLVGFGKAIDEIYMIHTPYIPGTAVGGWFIAPHRTPIDQSILNPCTETLIPLLAADATENDGVVVLHSHKTICYNTAVLEIGIDRAFFENRLRMCGIS